MRIPTVLLTTMTVVCSAAFADDVRPAQRLRTVYILEMVSGLDQHLADRLTRTKALGVVLDPARADAVLTDTLDDAFWNWLARCYPQPNRASRSASKPGAGPNSPSRPGNVFLVDPRTRTILWSTYERLPSADPDQLDRSASRIASRLKASLTSK
jgi:hypothetical protein